jgi:hypothetical protein
MRLVLCLCLAAMPCATQTTLTITTGVVTSTIDGKIYGQAVPTDIWGEAVQNRAFEEAIAEGAWRVVDGVLECTGDGKLSFGKAAWGDYEIGVDIVRPDGSGAVVIGARGGAVSGAALENGRSYHVRVRVAGGRLEAWLDGRALPGVAAPDEHGAAFLGTRGGPARFTNLKVTALDGAVLFSGLPLPARHWLAVGAVEAALTGEDPLNGATCVRLAVGSSEGGVEQRGLAVRAGDTLRGSLWLRGHAAGATVRLMDGGQVLASQLLPAAHDQWQEFQLALTPSASSNDATLRILLPTPSLAFLDQVSLMPDSARATGGFRPERLQALAGLRPTILSWSGADWRSGIGPQAKRIHGFGIDEAVALAGKVGAQLLVKAAGDARVLVEYCKAQSCRLRYLELPSGQEIAAIKQLDPAIRTVSPAAEADYRVVTSANNAKGKIFLADWNPVGSDWSAALDTAAQLNAMERNPAFGIAVATPVDSAAPAYAVMKLYREHLGTDVLDLRIAGGGLNAIATRTAEGSKIYLKLVNRGSQAEQVEVALRGDFPMLSAGMQIVDEGGRVIAGQVERSGLSARFRVPAASVAVVTLGR